MDQERNYGTGKRKDAVARVWIMPGAGQMGATLVNMASGGQTRVSGVFEGVLSLITFLALGSFIAWIPVGALAGILIVVAVSGPSVRNVGAVVAGTLLLSAVVILVTAGRRHPAWSLFLLAGAAAWYGTW